MCLCMLRFSFFNKSSVLWGLFVLHNSIRITYCFLQESGFPMFFPFKLACNLHCHGNWCCRQWDEGCTLNCVIEYWPRLVNLQPFLLFISFSPGNIAVLWCTCYTNVFKSVTNLFIKNLACSGICAGLVCVPFDIALNASPLCCLWVHTLLLCKTIKFLHRLFCSATVLNFAVIAMDRWVSGYTFCVNEV